MTIEVFQPVDPYVIAGTGPYNIGHPYGDNDEFVVSVFDGTNYIQLDAALWSISPESSDDEGDLTLDAATATTYAGNTMYIVRRTVPEQGWEGINGEREKGLEVQLDYLTMTVQDMQGQLDKGLFGLGASSGIPVVMVAGRVPIVSPDGSQLIAGPTADQITLAQGYAVAAQTAQGLSEDARDASVAAQGLSEDARDASVVAQGQSEGARDASVVAQGLSEGARDASVVAQGLSEGARDASVVAQGLSEGARDAGVVAQGLSEAARDKAAEWAEKAEDAEVDPGKYSALHHAMKAAASATAAQTFNPALYLALAGGTMTGALNLPAGGLDVGAGQLRVDAAGRVLKSSQPNFRAKNSAGASVSADVWEKMTGLDQVSLNVGSGFNSANSRFTAPIEGMYLFEASMHFSAASSRYLYSSFYKNGSIFKYGQGLSLNSSAWVGDNDLSWSSLIHLMAGDYVEPFVYSSVANSSAIGRRVFAGYFLG